jgi:hypothetical protein
MTIDDGRDKASLVEDHARAVSVEDSDHLDLGPVHTAICEGNCLEKSLTLVIA